MLRALSAFGTWPQNGFGELWGVVGVIKKPSHFIASLSLRYGLPKGGRCPPGQQPSKDAWASGCTWAVQKRLKTIDQALPAASLCS